MLRVILLPLLALAGGVGGFFLRRWELATAFEPGSGLAIPWAPASLALAALSVVLLLIFALLCRPGKRTLKDYDDAFSAPNHWAYLVLTAVSAAHLLLAGVFGLMDFAAAQSRQLQRLLLWLLCLVCFLCLLSIIMNNFRGRKRGKYSFMLLMPAYMCCLWLVVAYQQRTADPVVLDYVYELFAIICALLSFYFTAGFSFERAKTWRCAFFGLLAIYFSIVTLADAHDTPTIFLFRFVALYQLATVTTLLWHAFAPAPRRPRNHSITTQEVIPDE